MKTHRFFSVFLLLILAVSLLTGPASAAEERAAAAVMAAVTAAAVPAAATAADIPHIVGKTAPAECSAGALLKRTPAGCLRWGFASCVQQHRAVRQDKPVCGGGAQICRQGCHAVDGLPLQQPLRRYQ